jgi:hypothetical protein
MRKIVDYITVCQYVGNGFDDEVRELIQEDGYELYGSPYSAPKGNNDHFACCQALVKWSEE